MGMRCLSGGGVATYRVDGMAHRAEWSFILLTIRYQPNKNAMAFF
jgi:hypothetical protein